MRIRLMINGHRLARHLTGVMFGAFRSEIAGSLSLGVSRVSTCIVIGMTKMNTNGWLQTKTGRQQGCISKYANATDFLECRDS